MARLGSRGRRTGPPRMSSTAKRAAARSKMNVSSPEVVESVTSSKTSHSSVIESPSPVKFQLQGCLSLPQISPTLPPSDDFNGSLFGISTEEEGEVTLLEPSYQEKNEDEEDVDITAVEEATASSEADTDSKWPFKSVDTPVKNNAGTAKESDIRVSTRLHEKRLKKSMKIESMPKKVETPRKRKQSEIECKTTTKVVPLSVQKPSKMECWVEIWSTNVGKADFVLETVKEDEAPLTAIQRPRRVKRVPLAEKNSDNSQASPASGLVKKQGASKSASTAHSSNPLYQDSGKKVKAKDKQEPKSSKLWLVFPSGLDSDVKRQLLQCIKSRQKCKQGDDVVILLDLFSYSNDASLTDESKGQRLTRMSRILNFRTNLSDGMRRPLFFLQKRMLLWCAGEKTHGMLSGLNVEQADKALEIMVDEVEEYGPGNRWKELQIQRDFKVMSEAKLCAKFKDLIKRVREALNKGALTP